MTDEKRLAEARIAALYSSSNGNVQFLLQELSSRDAEIEGLRSDYNTTITYNIDERAKLASLLKEKDAEIERLRSVEASYKLGLERAPNAVAINTNDLICRLRTHVRSRGAPANANGAWALMLEAANQLQELARLRAQPQLRCKRTGNICGTDTWAAGHPCQCENCQRYLATVLRVQRAAAHPWYGPCDALGPDGQCAECLKVRALAAADDVERAKEIVNKATNDWLMDDWEIGKHADDFLIPRVAAALTAARQDARRQALEEASEVFLRSYWYEEIGPVLWWTFPVCEPPYVGTPLDNDWPDYHTHFTKITIPQQPLADNPTLTTGDIVSLFRAYRRAVEASPVSNPFELQEWRDLCAAMNAIDAAEGAR